MSSSWASSCSVPWLLAVPGSRMLRQSTMVTFPGRPKRRAGPAARSATWDSSQSRLRTGWIATSKITALPG